MKILGVDFTSAPKRGKSIVAAVCTLERELQVERILEFSDWPAYELWLGSADRWIGGFDFPFGLPKRFVERQGWPLDWPGMVKACIGGGKERFADIAMKAFMASKSDQDKHRQTDLKAGSHSPLKTKTNPPVGKMFYEGAWRLLAHSIHVPVLHESGSSKIALEAYPGFLARQIGIHHYKNDKPASASANLAARKRMVAALAEGAHPLGLRVRLPDALKRRAHADSSGDVLDAVLCSVQAAWASRQENFGLPASVVPCEGWIVSAR